MNKSVYLLLNLLTFSFISIGQASDLIEKPAIAKKTIIFPPSFNQPLVPAELPFIERCKHEGIKVNWEMARKDFLRAVKCNPNEFEIEVYQYLPLNDIDFKNKNFRELHEQYLSFYKTWYGLPSDEQKENKKPVVNATSSCSSSSSSSTSTISTTVDNNQDADTTHSATTPLLNKLRQRHPPTSPSPTVEVK